jgi:hypothetical protein
MIRLADDDVRLMGECLDEVSKDRLAENLARFMDFTPIHSGSQREEEAIQFINHRLEEYGLQPEILHYDAYLSDPQYATLKILEPSRMEFSCTPYRQVEKTGPEGVEGNCIYISPEEIGKTACRDKIALVEQTVQGDWLGLRDKWFLTLQKMGIKGLIVIEQDDFMPTVIHQRADFSVSGNPTIDNVHLIHRIPAVVSISHRDGQELKRLVSHGGARVKLTSVVETAWKTIPLLVAEITGTKDPDRFLLVNGHVDTPPFSPGCTDNASGIAAMMELARVLNKQRTRLVRSIRFAFWTGHETGRYAGSTWYNDCFWHELRYRCTGSLNVDSPGAEGATLHDDVPIGEVQNLVTEIIKQNTGAIPDSFRWPNRAGDNSFWGTGLPHTELCSVRPRKLYDPFVNFSGGGWWWHSPLDTIEHGDVDILANDVKANLRFIFHMTNCPVLPIDFIPYARVMIDTLEDLQKRVDKIKSYFNLEPVIDRVREFARLAIELEAAIVQAVDKGASETVLEKLNRGLMEVSRHINPVAHSNAEKTEQMSMETFGATRFPRIHHILELAKMPQPETAEFRLLCTKLLRERNFVEDGFYLANEIIKKTIASVGNGCD